MARKISEYPELFQDLEQIALDPDDRGTRARRATERILEEGTFRWVGVYDVAAGGASFLLASSEGEFAGVQDAAEIVVPVCSLDGNLVGTLEVQVDPASPLTEADRLQLEACAGVLWWLWSDDGSARGF